MKSRIPIICIAVLFILPAPYAFPQSENGQPEMADPCRSEPRDGQSPEPETDQQLTEKLDRCGGVLKPPPNGDEDIEEQPPATGETPIIPPRRLPDQPPQPKQPDDQK
jgi:hypothetical protein